MPIKCRLINEIGKRVYIRTYWEGSCPTYGGSYHNAMNKLYDIPLGETFVIRDLKEGEFNRSLYPIKCDHCDELVPFNSKFQLFGERLYDNQSGRPEPGDIYYADWYHHPESKKALCRWDNCNDPRGHRIVVLPNKLTWDLDSRASNCTMKEDRLHRCWVVNGEVPDLQVDKNGHTCNAGAGSIDAGNPPNNYHGYLHNGELRPC
jgi:hypothetical protein